MGGRSSAAQLGAIAEGCLIALLVAVSAPVVRAETGPADVASTSPSGVQSAAAPLTDSESPAPAASDDEPSEGAAPASQGEDEPVAEPTASPENQEGQQPADSLETAAPLPGDDGEGAVETASPPSAVQPADAAALAPDEASEKPAETAAPAPSEVGQQPSEATPSSPAAPMDAAQSPQADEVIAAIRSKLSDPALRKDAASDDLAALDAFYAARSGPPLWITPMGFTTKAQALIGEIQKAADWGLDPAAFDLPAAADLPASAEAQAADEVKLALAVLKYARYARGGRLSPARISPLFDQKPDLKDPKTVLSAIEASSSPGEYLISLHPKETQFEILRKTLLKAVARAKASRRSPSGDPVIQRLIVNMERWRWMPPELGSYYVWNNIPAFTTRVMKDGKSIYVEKAIVGQLKYATPIFSANMRSIVFNPEWVVPETIKLEDLQPRLRQSGPGGLPDVSILRENKLAVSLQGKPIAPEAINWERANIRQYTFTQPPGPDNVLGVLKFNFPNKHAIYMHDTVQRELFSETVRTLSHGCIRVHEPERLAALLLAEDKGWSADQVKGLIAKSNNSGVLLSRPVPVHLTYFTMAADGIGRLQTYADVYGLDSKMAQALFGKDTASAEDATGAKQQRRSALNGTGMLPGLFGN